MRPGTLAGSRGSPEEYARSLHEAQTDYAARGDTSAELNHCRHERKKPEDIDDQTLIRADVSRKAIAQVRQTVQDLLAGRMAPEQAAALAEKLATGTRTHDYPIMAEEAKTLGLPVSTEMPEEVYQFMSLFPQPTRTRPTVEYIPMPYRGRGGQGQSRR